ncbi:hypothetical protein ABC329_18055, partial [Vibrio cholerae]|uniref:hypothetical protein n=1 Tax=Vibrio cholerae TaxID=666 RepID=UPI0031F5C310
MNSLKIILGEKNISGANKFRLSLNNNCYLWRISMKLSRIALATMLVAAPLAAANAGVTVTPL